MCQVPVITTDSRLVSTAGSNLMLLQDSDQIYFRNVDARYALEPIKRMRSLQEVNMCTNSNPPLQQRLSLRVSVRTPQCWDASCERVGLFSQLLVSRIGKQKDQAMNCSRKRGGKFELHKQQSRAAPRAWLCRSTLNSTAKIQKPVSRFHAAVHTDQETLAMAEGYLNAAKRATAIHCQARFPLTGI